MMAMAWAGDNFVDDEHLSPQEIPFEQSSTEEDTSVHPCDLIISDARWSNTVSSVALVRTFAFLRRDFTVQSRKCFFGRPILF